MNTEYPNDWPTCPQCGRPALDGHITCGRQECDEGRQRRLRERALRKQQRAQGNGHTFCCALLCAVVITCASAPNGAHADDRRTKVNERSHFSESHNYIIERQQAYQVEGVPTSRLINGKREIDIYSNGLMFEKNNVVGVRK